LSDGKSCGDRRNDALRYEKPKKRSWEAIGPGSQEAKSVNRTQIYTDLKDYIIIKKSVQICVL
jgi:hypothetical protein